MPKKKELLPKPPGALALCTCALADTSTALEELNERAKPALSWKQDKATRRSKICKSRGLALLYLSEKKPAAPKAETKPAETKPAETKPAETKPAAKKKTETKPAAKPAAKKKKTKTETKSSTPKTS